MTDQSDTQALFENELNRVRRYLPHSSFTNLRAAAEMREQAHKDALDEHARLLTQERFERLQLADAYKRDLALLEQITQEHDALQRERDDVARGLTAVLEVANTSAETAEERVRELEAELEQLKK